MLRAMEDEKTPRLSLQRLFFGPAYRARTATRSAREARSRGRSELETRSVTSLPHSAIGGATGGSDTIVTIDNDSSSVSSSSGSGLRVRECPLCLAQLTVDNFPRIHTCPHRSCRDCLRQYLRIEITESRINIACPECAERFHPNDIQAILDDPPLMEKYELFMLRRVLVLDPDTRWCPAPDCT